MSELKKISFEDAKKLIEQESAMLVDVRNEEDFEEDQIPNAVHVDQYSFSDFTEETDKNIPLIVYCYRGSRSCMMGQRFIDEGFTTVYSLEGGYNAWKESN